MSHIDPTQKITESDINMNILLSRQLSGHLQTVILTTLVSKIKIKNSDKIEKIKKDIFNLIIQKNKKLCNLEHLEIFKKYNDIRYNYETPISKFMFSCYGSDKFIVDFKINYDCSSFNENIFFYPHMYTKYENQIWFSADCPNILNFNFKSIHPVIDEIDQPLIDQCKQYKTELGIIDEFKKPIKQKLSDFIFSTERIRDVYEIYPEIFDTVIDFYQKHKLKIPFKNKKLFPSNESIKKIKSIEEYRSLLSVDDFAAGE